MVHHAQGNGPAVTALVLGFIGVIIFFLPILPYVLGISALIFGVIGMKKPVQAGLAKAGIALGIITIGLTFLFWLLIGTPVNLV